MLFDYFDKECPLTRERCDTGCAWYDLECGCAVHYAGWELSDSDTGVNITLWEIKEAIIELTKAIKED